MRTLALIPARAGSKGIPGKNFRYLGGKTLLRRAVKVAQILDWVVVSTDDHLSCYKAIDRVRLPWWRRLNHRAGTWDLYFEFLLRGSDLSSDDTPMLSVVMDALKRVPCFDVLVLLQPTQPLRKPEHIKAALKLLEENPEATSVVSVVEIPAHYSPDYAVAVWPAPLTFSRRHDELQPWDRYSDSLASLDRMPQRRQDASPAYYRDGTVYAIRRKTIENGSLYGEHCVPLIIPSSESCTLDTEEDWQRAEAMVKR